MIEVVNCIVGRCVRWLFVVSDLVDGEKDKERKFSGNAL